MNSDSHYEIGSSHRVCQDYALHGEHNNSFYAIISDGCSSSKNVDIGARILCHAVKNALEEIRDMASSVYDYELVADGLTTSIKDYVLQKSKEVISSLGLKIEAMDATLLLAFSDKGKTYLISWGDGAFVFVKKNGLIEYSTIEYESGAPYYLSYEIDKARGQLYKKTFGDKSKTVRTYIDSDIIESKVPLYDPVIRVVDNNLYSSISVLSDGIMSYQYEPNNLENIQNKTLGKYSHDAIISRLVSYKNVQGEFVLRRMNKIKAETKKERIEHFDDVCCATIVM